MNKVSRRLAKHIYYGSSVHIWIRGCNLRINGFCFALMGVHLYIILRKSTKIVSILEVTSRSLWISTCAPFTTKFEDVKQFGSLRLLAPTKFTTLLKRQISPYGLPGPNNTYTRHTSRVENLDLTCKNSEDKEHG